MQVVPVQPVPRQSMQCQLGGQPCTLTIYQTAYAMHMDVYVGTAIIAAGVICENLNRIVRSAYLGFLGDFTFVDTTGGDDPIYTGLGSRFFLVYLEEDDL